MADRVNDERLREIATSDPLALAICAQMGEPSWADVRAIAAELLAARADLREAVTLLRNLQRGYLLQESWAEMEDTYRRIGALFDKHKETP